MAVFFGVGVLFASAPQGEYTELHSCEVYTGGCTASAWATSGGRSLVRIWKFERGERDGVSLAGLPVAVLEVGNDNLAMKGTRPTAAVAYLPKGATPAQQKALESWVKERGAPVTVSKVVPISYQQDRSDLVVRVGTAISFVTRAVEHCDSGSCGESLWYEPRGEIGTYTVLVNDDSTVDEPALKISWKDNSSKSVFFGHFGSRETAAFSLASVP